MLLRIFHNSCFGNCLNIFTKEPDSSPATLINEDSSLPRKQVKFFRPIPLNTSRRLLSFWKGVNLTLIQMRQMFSSYRKYFQYKSTDWFLYDGYIGPKCANQFHPSGIFFHPLKHQRFSDVFRVFRKKWQESG